MALGAEGDACTDEDSQGRSQPQSPIPLPEDFDPNEVSVSRDATGDPHKHVVEQPQVTADPDHIDEDDIDKQGEENQGKADEQTDEQAPSSEEGPQERHGDGQLPTSE